MPMSKARKENPTKDPKPAANPRMRLIVDCPECDHEQTEPFTEGEPLPVGEPFGCWNCGQVILITQEQADFAQAAYTDPDYAARAAADGRFPG